MKKISISLMLASFLLAQNVELDILTGDTKLACEAILCLSTGKPPHECKPALKRFYSIKGKYPHRTIKARKNFLKLCPTDQNTDKNYDSLINSLSHLESNCDVDTLNNTFNTKKVKVGYERFSEGSIDYARPIYKIQKRIITDKPQHCKDLEKQSYGVAHKEIKYTCDKKFYFEDDFNRGFYLNQINEVRYNGLPSELRVKQNNPSYNKLRNNYTMMKRLNIPEFLFFEKININKKCWVER